MSNLCVETIALMRKSAAGRVAVNLTEVLIVCAFLGVLAWVVVPQFSSAAGDVKRGALTNSLSIVRSALEVYRVQHGGRYPAQRSLREQLTQVSRPDGATSATFAPEYMLGPYLQDIPCNPYTLTNSVGVGPVGTSAWFYDETTGEFRANDSEENRAM